MQFGGYTAAALKTPPVAPAFALPARPQEQRWLVTDLWSADAVGIVGGEPNCCKSTPAIDLELVLRNDVWRCKC